MTAKQREPQDEESLAAKITRSIIMEAATGGLGTGIDHLINAAPGTDVTGMTGGAIQDGSVLHHGPGGEDLLERPSGGYLAHGSTEIGTSVEHTGGQISTIARDIDQAGTFSIDGHSIEVLDYVPGGNMVQAAGGNFDPGQMTMELVKTGAEEEMHRKAGGMIHSSNGKGETTGGGNEPGSHATGGEHAPGSLERQGEAGAGESGSTGNDGVTADGVSNGGSMHGHNGHRHIPDADENARDLEALAFQHHIDLDTAVETSDTAHVHTEIHAHGRTLTVDTDYEARLADHDQEREEAAEHAGHIAHSATQEVDDDRNGMHFRSQIAAHLDAQSHDEGIGM